MKNKISQEIKEMAPILSSMDKTNPFEVPEGYFDTLENRILDGLDKEAHIEVPIPEGYFDTLSDKVIEQIKTRDEAKVVSFNYKKWASIAAALIVIFGASLFFNKPTSSSLDSSVFAFDIESEEAIDYLMDTDELDMSDLIALDIYLEDFESTEEENQSIDDTDLDDFLKTLTQDELEELL